MIFIKNPHTINYEQHVYIINKILENDIKNNNINTELLKNISYARAYFINQIKQNKYFQLIKIENEFIKKYKITEFISRSNENIKINIKKVISSAQLSLNRIDDLEESTSKNIQNLTDFEGNKIVEILECEYIKNNIKKKDITYLILTKNMEKNLNKGGAETIFIDCTYKIVPPGLKNYKFLVIIGYNHIENKLVLYLYALIRHENIENFKKIFNYLRIKYNFEPKYVTTDYHRGQIAAINTSFPESEIILCWFHALKNIKTKIPNLNSKNINEKMISKNLIVNIKLMFFIPEDKIDSFYTSIKKNFNNKIFDSFYKYLNKFLFRKINGKFYLWNYHKLIRDTKINENNYFVTNNFIERANKTLNENLIYKKSSFSNFRNSILNTDIYFENKLTYNMNNPNLSKAIIYYIKNSDYLDKKTKKVKLIDLETMKNIYNTYVDIVKNNGLEMFDNKINEDYFVDDSNKIIIDDENSITSSSSEEESEEIEKSVIKNNNTDDDDSDKDNDNKRYGNNEKNNKNTKIKKNKNNIQYPKSKSKNKSKKNKNNKLNFLINDFSDQENRNNILNIQIKNNYISKEFSTLRPKKRNYITMINESKKIFGNNDEEYNYIKIKKHYKKSNDKIMDLNNLMSKLSV